MVSKTLFILFLLHMCGLLNTADCISPVNILTVSCVYLCLMSTKGPVSTGMGDRSQVYHLGI